MGGSIAKCLLGVVVVTILTAQTAWAQNGSISGRLTDEAGQPAVGVQVEAVASDGRVAATAFSGADGSYRLPNLAPGTYTLVITAVGFETRRIEDVRVASGQAATVATGLTTLAFRLNPVVVSASKGQQMALEAPASVSVIDEQEIDQRPAITPIDHVRSAPGVDLITYGLQSANVVTRGFNNLFSGSLHTLTDYRIASVPSLRVNLLHFIPATNADLDRMEVVLGPGSALYGPNTANGVLHIMTKSPLDDQGTTASIAGGERDVFNADFRTAHLLGENFGIKLSGQYLRGNEWEYVDEFEQAAREQADDMGADAFRAFWMTAGLSADEADKRFSRIAQRDFDLERWGLDARADWRITPELTAVFSTGTTRAVNVIEMTGIGAAQGRDWAYSYYQARASYDRLFAQVYLNTSDAGDTYLLDSGASIIDRSKLFVAQVQHGFTLGDRQDFTYGLDYLRTIPVTEGTINGGNEEKDELTEFGGYLQSETTLGPLFDLVLAGRLDSHSALEDLVFSPRAGIVFKPADNHNFRVTYNSAFETPTTLNMFLDIHGGLVPNESLAALGYGFRAQGPGTDGFSFRDESGNLKGMRSPFTPAPLGGPGELLPGNSATLWQLAVGVLQAQGQVDAATAAELLALDASGIGISVLDPNNPTAPPLPLGQANIADVPGIQESRTSTFEVGYKGLLGDRLLLAADAWYTEKSNFVSPLIAQTPFLLLDGTTTVQMLVPYFIGKGMSQEQATQTALGMVQGSATVIGDGVAEIPLAVVSSPEVNAAGADMLVTYRNFGEVNLWGADLSATALLSDQWSLELSGSYVSDDHFRIPLGGTEEILALNAPSLKGSAALAFDDAAIGFNGEARVRFNNEFPVNSAGQVGLECIEIGDDPCVEAATLVDLTLGYQLPMMQGATVQIQVQNVFDTPFRNFLRVPEIGRFALLRLRYTL